MSVGVRTPGQIIDAMARQRGLVTPVPPYFPLIHTCSPSPEPGDVIGVADAAQHGDPGGDGGAKGGDGPGREAAGGGVELSRPLGFGPGNQHELLVFGTTNIRAFGPKARVFASNNRTFASNAQTTLG